MMDSNHPFQTPTICWPFPRLMTLLHPPCTTQLDKVLAAVEALGATVTVVLTTHKHWCLHTCEHAHTHAEA